jgi:hypothetical protein
MLLLHGAGEPNAFHAASFPEQPAASAAFWGNFYEAWNRTVCFASPPLEPWAVQCGPRNDSPCITGFSMVITSAHIPAIVALIAGLLILIMPRLLNFIVAIYLIVIGLVGLGLLRWLHM